MKQLKLSLILCMVLGVTGCGSVKPPADLLSLSPKVAAKHNTQIRKFDISDEKQILAASAGVLQDMGFTINETESKLGVIVANKSRKTDLS